MILWLLFSASIGVNIVLSYRLIKSEDRYDRLVKLYFSEASAFAKIMPDCKEKQDLQKAIDDAEFNEGTAL